MPFGAIYHLRLAGGGIEDNREPEIPRLLQVVSPGRPHPPLVAQGDKRVAFILLQGSIRVFRGLVQLVEDHPTGFRPDDLLGDFTGSVRFADLGQ